MTTTDDYQSDDLSDHGEARSADRRNSGAGQRMRTLPPTVVVVNADRSLFELIKEWLAYHGCNVIGFPAGSNFPLKRFDLAVVDVPFPRPGGLDQLQRIVRSNPGTPIIALSSNFIPGIERSGTIARALGVACVLPMPITRDALVMAVRQVLRI